MVIVYFGYHWILYDDGDFSKPKGQKGINNWPWNAHVYIIYKIYKYFMSGSVTKKN